MFFQAGKTGYIIGSAINIYAACGMLMTCKREELDSEICRAQGLDLMVIDNGPSSTITGLNQLQPSATQKDRVSPRCFAEIDRNTLT
jgi:hypothetical protein